MAESGGQEKTEDATPRRRQQAQEKGQVARSKELASVSVLIMGALSFMMFGEMLGKALLDVMGRYFSLHRDDIFDLPKLFDIILGGLEGVLWVVLAILLVQFLAAFAGATGVGGIRFSAEAARPKLSKMSPLAGFKRMFGVQSLVELLKSILKVLLVAGAAFYIMHSMQGDLLQLGQEVYPLNFFHALDMLVNFVLLISCTLLIVAAIDIPFQIWQHNNQLKMTLQEVKDEHKDMEGKPEVKGRIRQLQREMAQSRMMAEVPQADVIITNPEHFSVALRYKHDIDRTPVVIAKGVDFHAFKIREIAKEHKIAIVPAPPLARALYHTTELEQPIPDELFTAVAQVLAYVFQLNVYKKRGGNKPELDDDNMSIPSNMRY
ncbi:flagellar biosynthesis protein FlhB [Vibrio sp.]|nr:flagellar biosynthesis protein FlhB [Vibrio sp.]